MTKVDPRAVRVNVNENDLKCVGVKMVKQETLCGMVYCSAVQYIPLILKLRILKTHLTRLN